MHEDYLRAGATVITHNTYSTIPRVTEDSHEHRVDLFSGETMSTSDETRAVAIAACEYGKSVWVSWTLSVSLARDGTARLTSGETIAVAITALNGLTIQGLLVKCSTPELTTAAMPEHARDGRPFGASANAFWADLSQNGPGETVEKIANRSDLNPQAYATHVWRWVEAGERLAAVCQTDSTHIAEIKWQLTTAAHEL